VDVLGSVPIVIRLGFDTTLIINMYKKERMGYRNQRRYGDNLTEENMSIKPLGEPGLLNWIKIYINSI
jgi:hypothetical protein